MNNMTLKEYKNENGIENQERAAIFIFFTDAKI